MKKTIIKFEVSSVLDLDKNKYLEQLLLAETRMNSEGLLRFHFISEGTQKPSGSTIYFGTKKRLFAGDIVKVSRKECNYLVKVAEQVSEKTWREHGGLGKRHYIGYFKGIIIK